MLTFGQALEHLKNGIPMQRVGWNGKNLFVFMQVPAEIPISVVPNMQSLPQKIKDEFVRRGLDSIKYSNQFAIVDHDNNIKGWAPSTSDALANDWQTAF